MSNGAPPNATGSNTEPPNEGSLERRVTALEFRLDAVLPTLATKADLAELAVQFEARLAGLAVQFEALRGEGREQNAELRAEFQVGQERSRKEMEQLRTEIERFSNRLLRWMIATTLSLIITFTALFVGVGNLLISRLSPPASPAAAVSLDDHNRSPRMSFAAVKVRRV